MGKTRALFKKTGGIKGTCHAGMGKTKDKNDKDLTEAKEIKRGGKNAQNYIMTQTTTMVCGHSPRARHPGV